MKLSLAFSPDIIMISENIKAVQNQITKYSNNFQLLSFNCDSLSYLEHISK